MKFSFGRMFLSRIREIYSQATPPLRVTFWSDTVFDSGEPADDPDASVDRVLDLLDALDPVGPDSDGDMTDYTDEPDLPSSPGPGSVLAIPVAG
jgi:hypothetical protein